MAKVAAVLSLATQEEFVKYCKAARDEAEHPKVDDVMIKEVQANGLFGYLGPTEIAHGYKKAIAIIAKLPECAKTKNSNGNQFLPLHTLLMANHGSGASKGAAAAVAKAAADAAADLLEVLVKAYPEAVSARVMVPPDTEKSPLFPWGHVSPLAGGVAYTFKPCHDLRC